MNMFSASARTVKFSQGSQAPAIPSQFVLGGRRGNAARDTDDTRDEQRLRAHRRTKANPRRVRRVHVQERVGVSGSVAEPREQARVPAEREKERRAAARNKQADKLHQVDQQEERVARNKAKQIERFVGRLAQQISVTSERGFLV